MKIALLSGAYKNAGDFLIVERSKALLQYVYPDCEVIEFVRSKRLDDSLDIINSCDVMILAGGPAYVPRLCPAKMPLVNDLRELRPKLFALGLGQKGVDNTDIAIYDKKLNSQTREVLARVVNDTKALGCRDWHSVRLLRANGFSNAVMTGCPAWYDLGYVDKLKPNSINEIKKICVSDPGAIVKNRNQAAKVLAFLRGAYPNAEITLVFHRGITEDSYTSSTNAKLYMFLKKKAEDIGIQPIDISYGSAGMSIYNNCDLHVGYRVHAHVYCLSRGCRSVLIEEDGRGAGVNQALGLPSITSYLPDPSRGMRFFSIAHRRVFKRSRKTESNPYVVNALGDYLSFIFDGGGGYPYDDALRRIQGYYSVMIKHIESIANYI